MTNIALKKAFERILADKKTRKILCEWASEYDIDDYMFVIVDNYTDKEGKLTEEGKKQMEIFDKKELKRLEKLINNSMGD